MSFTYSGDPSVSVLDRIRFETGDTDSANPILTDTEITWIISEYANLSKQLAVAFRQCASSFATKPTRRKLGPQEESTLERLRYFKDRAEYYEKMLNFTGTPPLPEYDSELMFAKGMMENV